MIPVDSEHSALFQLLRKEPPGTVERLVADGLRRPVPRLDAADELRDVERRATRSRIPTWDMGGKITIDSATLMNKGLEVIEAHHLFGFPYDRIDVVVHPESIVHAIVAPERRRVARAPRVIPTCGSRSPMRCTIPERADVPVRALDLAAGRHA